MCISKYAFSFSSFVFKNDLTSESLSFSHLWLWLMYILMCFAIIWSISKKKYRSHKLATFKELIFTDILIQLMFEDIWIDSNRSFISVIERRLERSVSKSVESDTTSQEGIIKVSQRLCWHCFYLQKITFLTKPYRIWLGLTLKINRILTAVKGMTRSMPAHNKHLVQVNLAGLCELKMSKILYLKGHGGWVC